MQSEDLIRDNISQNLQLIDPNLKFLHKEYKLPNYVGSKGFVDILATDVFNNYVIIEIKRSKATSRETLQEIVKYVGLLKQNFQARDSEIRVIILSTHWEELFIPFCEFLYQSTLSVKGYILSVNENGFIKDATEILPEPVTQQRRKLAYTYKLAFFYSKEKQENYINLLSKKSQAIGMQDFVITDLSLEGQSRSPFSYATCYSFNEQSITNYRAMEAVLNKIDMEEGEFDSQEHFISHLEQCVLVALYETGSHDSMEVGSPQALQSMIKEQGWKIGQLYRFGIFQSDPRLTDEMLIRELQGYDGSNPYLYSNFADSSQKDRLSEILGNASNPFEKCPRWQKNLDNLLEYIKNQNRPFRIIVHTYSPKSIFYGIYRFLKYQETDYLPMYFVFVDYYLDSDSHIYEGMLKWTGKKTDERSYNFFLKDNSRSFISKAADICVGFFDQDILTYFNLSLKNKLTTINQKQERKILFFLINEQKSLVADTGPSHSMVAWVKQNFTFCWSIIKMYEANSLHI